MINESIVKEDFKSFSEVAEYNFKGDASNKRRTFENVNVRYSIFLAMEYEGYDYKIIANTIGLNRGNVFHGLKAASSWVETDPKFKKRFDAVVNLEFIDFDTIELIEHHIKKANEHMKKAEHYKNMLNNTSNDNVKL